MARCVVVGASGYLGNRLLPLLADRGHTVVAVSRSGDVGRYAGVRAIKGDATEPAIMRAALERAEVVYFLMHSLDRSDFAAVDRRAAEVLAAEAATGLVAICARPRSSRQGATEHANTVFAGGRPAAAIAGLSPGARSAVGLRSA